MEKALIPNNTALPFLLAGRCEVTIKSLLTDIRFTYSIKKKESTGGKSGFVYFLSLISGRDYIYAGIIIYDEASNSFIFRQGEKGKISYNSKAIKAIIYVMNKLYNEIYNIEVEIYHCGKCGRCGRKLTTPESILTGLGPECAKISGIPYHKSIK